MKECYVCWRPLQLFNTLNYLLYTNNNCVHRTLFLSTVFEQFDIDYDEINKYFENIIIFSEKTDGGKTPLYRLLKHFSLKRELERHTKKGETDFRFDTVVGSGYSYYFVFLANYNYNSHLIKLEDGIGSYMDDEIKSFSKLIRERVLKKFHRGPLAINFSEEYLYYPEMAIIDKHGIKRKKMATSPSIVEIINKILRTSQNPLYKNAHYVYLTSDDVFFNKYEKAFLLKHKNYFEDAILRYHPSIMKKLEAWNNVDTMNCLWEIQCESFTNEVILIALFSTAQFYPFLFYGKKCKLIFTYKLFLDEKTKEYKDIENFIRCFSQTYSGEIFVPNSEEQLQSYLTNR